MAESNSNEAHPAETIEIPEDGEGVPPILPVLPTRDAVLFPDMLMPLVVNTDRDTALIDHALLNNRFVAFVPMTNPADGPPQTADLFGYGTAGVILKMLKLPDGGMRLLVQGLKRLKVQKYDQAEPFFLAKTKTLDDMIEKSVKLDALHHSIRDQWQKLIEMLPQVSEEIKVASVNITDASHFCDLVAANLNLSMDERCMILEEYDVYKRLEKLSILLGREFQIVELGSKIQSDVKEKISKGQREFFLREQLKAIREELGDTDDANVEIDELKEQLEEAGLPEEARKEADRELKRLERMQPGSSEYTVARTYLDWMVSVPWSKTTEDRLDVVAAREILDADHYDLTKVKDRIIEFLAVRKIHPEGRSPILCFVGPPGVGKTSLGRSIARAMEREFVRISLGGVRDEAEIRGHRRTYIGALPGRIIQGLRKAGSKNPVFMMDEIDKLQSDFRGDPASALLEVLDPEQNREFSDHYLDVSFDLSNVIFITTANQLETIPPPLRDRMEILRIPGYAEEEKVQIARRHLIPRILNEHGLDKKTIRFPVAAIKRVMGDYTREAGLRNLEREMASVVRKLAVKIAQGKRGPFKVKPENVKEYLGPPRFHGEMVRRTQSAGVSVGLAWNATGGDILFIESTAMPGKRLLHLTGSLGDVIKESAHAALSWIRTHARELAIIEDTWFDANEIHIHFPEGATPKDGPSAGIALVASLYSLLTNKPLKHKLAMTGEITLRGKILPVGGIKEKMLAARRAGIKEVCLPADNIHDLEELPAEVRRDLKFHPLDEIGDMLGIAFPQRKTRRKATKKKTRKG